MSALPDIEMGAPSGSLLPTTMPVAPAASALAALMAKEQVPRST